VHLGWHLHPTLALTDEAKALTFDDSDADTSENRCALGA
jgi:hypothetical protein